MSNPDENRCLHYMTVGDDGGVQYTHVWYARGAAIPRAPQGDEVGRVHSYYSQLYSTTSTDELRRNQEAEYEKHLLARHQDALRFERNKITAEKLLNRVMSDEQRASWKQNHYIDVTGKSGNRYRLEESLSGTVTWLASDGKVRGQMCLHVPSGSTDGIPASYVAANLLALTTDEVNFIRMGARYAGQKPRFDENGKAVEPQPDEVRGYVDVW